MTPAEIHDRITRERNQELRALRVEWALLLMSIQACAGRFPWELVCHTTDDIVE